MASTVQLRVRVGIAGGVYSLHLNGVAQLPRFYTFSMASGVLAGNYKP